MRCSNVEHAVGDRRVHREQLDDDQLPDRVGITIRGISRAWMAGLSGVLENNHRPSTSHRRCWSSGIPGEGCRWRRCVRR